jgi:hypothetical protein
MLPSSFLFCYRLVIIVIVDFIFYEKRVKFKFVIFKL